MSPSQRDQSDRAKRIVELDQEIARLRNQMAPLLAERQDLETAQHRETWPDGPFTLHYWSHHQQYDDDEFDTPQEALRVADSIEDHGTGSTERITDRHGEVVYDLTGYPPKRVKDSYPDPAEVLR